MIVLLADMNSMLLLLLAQVVLFPLFKKGISSQLPHPTKLSSIG